MPIATVPAEPVQLRAAEPAEHLWYSNADYPEAARRANIQADVEFRLTVDASGKPVRCEIINPGRAAAFENLTCELTMRRGRLRPAIVTAGAREFGVFRSHVRWTLPDSPPLPPSAADLELDVNRLSARTKDRLKLQLAMEVGADGKRLGCSPKEGGPQPYGLLACTKALGFLDLKPARDGTGQPVTSVQNVTVTFRQTPAN